MKNQDEEDTFALCFTGKIVDEQVLDAKKKAITISLLQFDPKQLERLVREINSTQNEVDRIVKNISGGRIMDGKTDSAPRPAIKNYLIADPSSSRKNVRAVLTDLGANGQNIHQCGTLGDAKDLIQSLKPEVLFVDQEMAGPKLEELMNLQEQVLPPGSSKAFFLISSKASGADASNAAEDSIDAVLVKPFTLETLKDQVMAALELKFFPSPQQKLINTGAIQVKSNWFAEALETFRNAVELDPHSPLAQSHLGQCMLKMGKADEALAVFKLGLEQVPTHYRCLLGAVDASSELKDFDSAYAYARKLAENHPIPLKKLPDFIRLSVVNGKFDDVLEFYKVVDGISGIDEALSINVSAGLVVCGLLYLKDGKSKEAIDIFKKAEMMARGNPKILTRIAVGLARAKLEIELGALMRSNDERGFGIGRASVGTR